MNQHIDLVKKWLANPDSVSQKELEDNAEAADRAAEEVALAAYWAAAGNVDQAKRWVDEYAELVN